MSNIESATKAKIHQYLKKRFSKEQLIMKAIILGIATVLVLSLALPFFFWLNPMKEYTVIGENPFIFINVVHNEGIGWSAMTRQTAAIYAIQSVIFVLLLVVYLFLCQNKLTASFVALAMVGGLFNLFQRVGCNGYVLDYFEFGFWKEFPIFNWPDIFVVIGVFGFVISYIVITIYHAVKEEKSEKVDQISDKIPTAPAPKEPVKANK